MIHLDLDAERASILAEHADLGGLEVAAAVALRAALAELRRARRWRAA